MPASRFLKYTGRNWPNPVCSFYLPVSTSRDATVGPVIDVVSNCCSNLTWYSCGTMSRYDVLTKDVVVDVISTCWSHLTWYLCEIMSRYDFLTKRLLITVF